MNKNNLKGLRYIISAFSILLILFTYMTLNGYRMLDVFSSPEWEPEGKTTGSQHYYHK
jgi:hypothetical protein